MEGGGRRGVLSQKEVTEGELRLRGVLLQKGMAERECSCGRG